MEQESSPPPQENTPAEAAPQETSSSSGEVSKDARTMALLCHLLGVFTSILVPLILWLVKKDEDEFIDDQGKEALNFQITIIIAWVAAIIISIVTFGIGVILFPLLGLYVMIFGIIAALKSNEGVRYRYPATIRLIK